MPHHYLAPGPAGSSPRELTCYAGGLGFTADDGNHGRELQTLAGPRARPVLHELAPGRSSRPSRLSRAGEYLFFSANDAWTSRRARFPVV